VAVVVLGVPRGGDAAGVVEVVVPQAVHAVAFVVGRLDVANVLELVLRDDDNRPLAGGIAGGVRQLGEDVRLGIVVDRLGGVDAKAVEMVLANPMGGAGGDEVAHAAGAFAVVVDRIAPFGGMPLGGEVGRERG